MQLDETRLMLSRTQQRILWQSFVVFALYSVRLPTQLLHLSELISGLYLSRICPIIREAGPTRLPGSIRHSLRREFAESVDCSCLPGLLSGDVGRDQEVYRFSQNTCEREKSDVIGDITTIWYYSASLCGV